MKAKGMTVFLCLAVLSMIAFSPALSSAAEVYLEGAYDEAVLDVYIYADFTEANVISYGVRLNYDPVELAVVSASKTSNFPDGDPTPYTSNATVWELGEGTNKDNPVPDTTTYPGAVVFKGGILNESDPTAGVVNQTRVFLGKVQFGPGTGGVIPATPNLTLTYAEGDGTGSYKNFVRYDDGGDTPGQVLDGPGIVFRPVNYTTPRDITRRCDANRNGAVTPADINAVKNFIGNLDAPCFTDCNNNGSVSPSDINRVKSEIQ